MTSEELRKLFQCCVEDAQFHLWDKGKVRGSRFVYACQNGAVWKFTRKGWWQFVTKTIRNQGAHRFLISNALLRRPSHIINGHDGKFYSSDSEMRCVNPWDWTLENWTNELTAA
jgi:hypothetical protein